jgi:hypothetical protein
VATARLATGLRAAAAAVVLGGLGWVGYQTIHAGDDIPPPPPQALTRLSAGSASDKRLDGKSWTLDYATATMSSDGSTAEIDDIRDGIITRNGKPYMHVRAKHVSANMVLNSFIVRGPVTFREIGGQHRTLQTIGAQYTGYSHVLELANRTEIRSGPVHLTVDHATIDFSTGKTVLGRIVGTM